MWNRESDLVITVIQNNKENSLTIQFISLDLANILGFDKKNLIKAHLKKILDKDSYKNLRSQIEFSKQGSDLADAIKNLGKIKFVDNFGATVSFIVKAYFVNETQDKIEIKLLVIDSIVDKQMLLFRNKVRQIKKKYKNLEIENKELYETSEILNLVIEFQQLKRRSNLFVMFELSNLIELIMKGVVDDYEMVGKALMEGIREKDIAIRLSENQYGLILFDCNKSDAKEVIARLVQRIYKHCVNDKNTKLSFNVGYTVIKYQDAPLQIINRCYEALQKSAFSGGNKAIFS